MRTLVVASSERELEGVQTNLRKVVVGVGKVQSAVRAMEAIALWKPSRVICIGYAGAVDPSLTIGEIVQAESVVQYDIDLTSFGLRRCEVPSGDGSPLLGVLPLSPLPLSAPLGRFGTADRFLLRRYREEHPFLRDELGLLCADMESFSVAYAAKRCGVKCSLLRVISDDERGRRPGNFAHFVREANERFSSALSAVSE